MPAGLFEPHCMRWDHPPGKEKRALLAAAAGGGARTAGFKYSTAPASGSVGHAAEQSPTLTADWHAPAVYGIVGNSIGRKPENGGNG
ncbi:MAG: DNA (cytosine-5-)-methyltransferase, partial [Eggerthellaceae bacterium]